VRVTHLGAYRAALERIGGRLSDYSATQQRLASGKRLAKPSDDPIGMNRALELRSQLNAADQHARNANDGKMWIDLADSKLQTIVGQLQRARELAVRGATYTGDDERGAIAKEVGQLREDLLMLANDKEQGRGLFAGFGNGDAVQSIAGTWTYVGDAGQVNRRVGEDEVVSVNVTADDVFGFSSGRDVFTILDDFEAALYANDTAALEQSISDIDASLDTVLDSLAVIGARANRIDAALTRNADEVLTLKDQLSTIEDVDIAEAVMELKLQQTAYEAALTAFAQSSQTSLVDFLR
jgi:flagellar hook-associated protein 3 FlgL